MPISFTADVITSDTHTHTYIVNGAQRRVTARVVVRAGDVDETCPYRCRGRGLFVCYVRVCVCVCVCYLCVCVCMVCVRACVRYACVSRVVCGMCDVHVFCVWCVCVRVYSSRTHMEWISPGLPE